MTEFVMKLQFWSCYPDGQLDILTDLQNLSGLKPSTNGNQDFILKYLGLGSLNLCESRWTSLRNNLGVLTSLFVISSSAVLRSSESTKFICLWEFLLDSRYLQVN